MEHSHTKQPPRGLWGLTLATVRRARTKTHVDARPPAASFDRRGLFVLTSMETVALVRVVTMLCSPIPLRRPIRRRRRRDHLAPTERLDAVSADVTDNPILECAVAADSEVIVRRRPPPTRPARNSETVRHDRCPVPLAGRHRALLLCLVMSALAWIALLVVPLSSWRGDSFRLNPAHGRRVGG